jgi:hypothetical protein
MKVLLKDVKRDDSRTSTPMAPCGSVAKEELHSMAAPTPSLMEGIILLFLETTLLMHDIKAAG